MSSNKQQTAVDIAFEKLANQGLLITRDYKNLRAYREAKEMEKERIINAWKAGDGKYDKVADKLAEQYYEQTYGGGER
jgi:hypothetical protein